MNYTKEYKDCLDYIDSYWGKIIHKPVKKKLNHNAITIPYSYITPNDKKFNYIFYWDTYFMFRGLLGTKKETVLKDMIHNFAYLLEAYHIIPNFNSPAAINRSQPPFFSSMILDSYQVSLHSDNLVDMINKLISLLFNKPVVNKKWLRTMIDFAKEEYSHVWNDPENEYHHRAEGYLLNRYGDRDIGYAHSSELESGWDLTSRFYNRCDEFLPVDLNVFLYKYELDFAKVAEIMHDENNLKYWQDLANMRKINIQTLMWNKIKGFYYDYEYKYKRRSGFLSLAGFTPLWAGIATIEQATQAKKLLKNFETDYGLVITSKNSLALKIDLSKMPRDYRPALEAVLKPKQWDYPHIWPPLEYLTVIGFLRYGFIEDARRIMEKSIKIHARLFRKHKTFFEKIDGVTGEKPKDFHYQTQSGFGWTNAIFYRYVQILTSLENGEIIYNEQKNDTFPKELSILH